MSRAEPPLASAPSTVKRPGMSASPARVCGGCSGPSTQPLEKKSSATRLGTPARLKSTKRHSTISIEVITAATAGSTLARVWPPSAAGRSAPRRTAISHSRPGFE